MWDEVQECVEKNKHELRVTGKALEKRLEESDGRVPESLCATGPLFTFVELSSCARLTQLPNNVDLMTNLHELLVQNCGLSSLPPGIGSLPLLRTLILEGNQLQQLPDVLFDLPKLHTLNVSHNQLQHLPDALVNAKELHVLNISCNAIQTLPSSLVKLPKLSTLIASHNAITAIPEGMSKLSMLTDLQFSHCGLTSVPQDLAAVPKLKVLVLDPNPFEDRKLTKTLKEGRLKNILTHIKKTGTPPSKETVDAAAEAVKKLELAAQQQRLYELLLVDKERRYDVYVHPEVRGVRQHLVCAVLQGVNFTPALYEQFISLQTSIHESPLCNKREAAAIGTHDVGKLQLPLQYEALSPAEIKFVPLAREKDTVADGAAAGDGAVAEGFKPGQEITADQLPQFFAGDKSMLRYLSYIQNKPIKAAPLYAILRDSSQAVLSVSPVINADFCKVTADSRDILIEVSSADSLEVAQNAANEYIYRFAEAYKAAVVASGEEQQSQPQLLQVAPVRLLTVGTGHVRSIFPK